MKNATQSSGRGALFGMVLVALLFSASPDAMAVETLADAFAAASAGAGYDTLLLLDPAELYTGGLVLPTGHHCIIGNGARINLQGGSVIVSTDTDLDIFGCSLANGDVALDYSDGATGCVMGNNFYNNYVGLKFWLDTNLTVINNNFVANTHYGVYRHEDVLGHYLAYNNVYDNLDGDYIYYCPG